MKKISILIIILAVSGSLFSQTFERQLGMRFGTMSGITGKVVMNKKTAIQSTLGFRKGGVQLYTMLEAYKMIDKNANQNWYMYFGGGIHVGYINGYNKVRRWSNSAGYFWEEERASGLVFGLDAVMGVEYNIPAVPLVVFFEFKPMVELQGFNSVRVNFWDSAIGIVYRFNN